MSEYVQKSHEANLYSQQGTLFQFGFHFAIFISQGYVNSALDWKLTTVCFALRIEIEIIAISRCPCLESVDCNNHTS